MQKTGQPTVFDGNEVRAEEKALLAVGECLELDREAALRILRLELDDQLGAALPAFDVLDR